MSRAIVVQGEASESDDEPEIVASLSAASNSNVADTRFGVRVAGEDSESEDDAAVDDDLPPLIVDTSAKNDQLTMDLNKESGLDNNSISQELNDQLKYDTLLHKKLKERNVLCYKRIVDTASQMYLTAAKDVSNTTQQLWKLQNTVQDVSHNMRSLTNDLFYLEDRIDIIATCNLLPSINI